MLHLELSTSTYSVIGLQFYFIYLKHFTPPFSLASNNEHTNTKKDQTNATLKTVNKSNIQCNKAQ